MYPGNVPAYKQAQFKPQNTQLFSYNVIMSIISI